MNDVSFSFFFNFFFCFEKIHYRFIWNEDRVLVIDPNLVQVVLNTPSIFGKENLPGYSLLRFTLGDGLITLNGEEHKKHRKLISPAFKVLTKYYINIYLNFSF